MKEPDGPGSPARQSLRRPLTAPEIALAEALVTIFGSGMHDFAAVVEQLTQRGVARPSGSADPWSVTGLEDELRRINDSLDEAYARASAVHST